ncbi:glycosyltransferase family 2 protein [Mucilaginibacter sp. BJC16-A38]|uniref:glycosyltransferase family 2 protein n=1 Tax=Mucilaginibacter phenanthrenivorans TaxID=1234842 RepID=UPI0021579F04|nr:glycosyltransferase family 2 protein [Mucilaginibacter phenanthrenivorans]MCR8556361.1 glycosyltransferase family 2 protein [Mucilaginibacter phenanthrenivorans]
MKLSVIIVNRNACIMLKQALNSLIDACKSIDYELIIVDNASADHSLDMLANNFPGLKVIVNETDLGVAKANNQGLEACTGEYILIVSADTIIIRDSVEKMVAFMDTHTDAGGMGIRMLSPQGRFLPESIHGLTSTWGAFLKMIGFAKHLSKTRLYDRNRKDWVEEFRESEVDILNGACMMLRRTALNEAGMFDERFLMFGHDIDLSYRIRLAGFKNYYFPKTYIINFESLRLSKFSWDYIKYFYGAMFIFAVKYLIRVPEIKVKGIPQLFPSTYEVK